MYTNKDENTHAELARDVETDFISDCSRLVEAERQSTDFIHDKESANELLELLINDDSIAIRLLKFVRDKRIDSAEDFLKAVRLSVVSSFLEDL